MSAAQKQSAHDASRRGVQGVRKSVDNGTRRDVLRMAARGLPLFLPALLAARQRAANSGAEQTLAGLRPGRDTLARVIKLYGKQYSEAFPDTPDLLLWADPRKNLYLRIELTSDHVINAITVASFGPGEVRETHLPPQAGVTGRGLRLGDPVEKVRLLYGPAYFEGPSSEGGRELLLVVHKFAVPEDQPQVMETSYDPKSRKLLKITLTFPYY